MRIAVASSSLIALPTIERLSNEHEISQLISTPDAPTGRGQVLAPNVFSDHFKDDSRLVRPKNMQELVDVLSQQTIDLAIAIAYGKLLNVSALSAPKFGWINLHFSLLPKWRGAAPVQRAMMAGETELGFTIFKLDEGMDTGPVYSQGTYRLGANENAGEVLNKLAVRGADEMPAVLSKISQGVAPIPQPRLSVEDSGSGLAPKINKEEARINWRNSAQTIHNQIRAFNPNPIAWTEFRGDRLRVISAEKSERKLEANESGVVIFDKGEVLVAALDGFVRLKNVVPAGKKEMSAADWARGMRITEADRCQ